MFEKSKFAKHSPHQTFLLYGNTSLVLWLHICIRQYSKYVARWSKHKLVFQLPENEESRLQVAIATTGIAMHMAM